MSNYHPDADPESVAMNSHYDAIFGHDFYQAMHVCIEQEFDVVSLDCEKKNFCHSLWKRGFKIVPVVSPTNKELAKSVVDILDVAARGYNDWKWSGMENPDGEEFGSLVEKLISKAKTVLSYQIDNTTPQATNDEQPPYYLE